MGLPLPTRWSIQIPKGQYRDHLVGQLTNMRVKMWWKFSRNISVRIGNAVGYVEIVQRCGNGKLCVTLPWPSLRRLKSPWMVTFVNSPFTITFGLWIVLCSYPIARGEQKLSQFAKDKNSVKTSNKKLNCWQLFVLLAKSEKQGKWRPPGLHQRASQFSHQLKV